MIKQFYTYLYVDSKTNEILYVGKGCLAKNGKDRAIRHLDENQDSMISRKSKKMIREGNSPLIHKINCSTEEAAFALEIGLIKIIGRKDLSKGSLLNLTDGGENPPKGVHKIPHSEETKKLISKKIKKAWKSNPHPSGMLGKKQSFLHNEEMSKRLRINNPMKNPETVARCMASRKANRVSNGK